MSFNHHCTQETMFNLYVGNISFQTTESELEAAFAAYGAVERVHIARDPASGQPRAFGFVEMKDREEALNAISKMNGHELHGRAINVYEAEPKQERANGNGFGREGGTQRASV